MRLTFYEVIYCVCDSKLSHKRQLLRTSLHDSSWPKYTHASDLNPAGTTSKQNGLSFTDPHSSSGLIRPKGSLKTSSYPKCLHHPVSINREKSGLWYLLPKQSKCPGYSDYTGETHQEIDRKNIRRCLLLKCRYDYPQSKIATHYALCIKRRPVKFPSSYLKKRILLPPHPN